MTNRTCLNCSRPVESGALFCPRCEANLTPREVQAYLSRLSAAFKADVDQYRRSLSPDEVIQVRLRDIARRYNP